MTCAPPYYITHCQTLLPQTYLRERKEKDNFVPQSSFSPHLPVVSIFLFLYLLIFQKRLFLINMLHQYHCVERYLVALTRGNKGLRNTVVLPNYIFLLYKVNTYFVVVPLSIFFLFTTLLLRSSVLVTFAYSSDSTFPVTSITGC